MYCLSIYMIFFTKVKQKIKLLIASNFQSYPTPSKLINTIHVHTSVERVKMLTII